MTNTAGASCSMSVCTREAAASVCHDETVPRVQSDDVQLTEIVVRAQMLPLSGNYVF